MEKEEQELREVRRELVEVRKAVDLLGTQVKDLIRGAWVRNFSWLILAPTATLETGACHTFHSAPNGTVTITNNSNENATVEFTFANGPANSGLGQTGEVRSLAPPAWPVTICNQGPAPVTVAAV
jgi:hypothetical protein